MEYKTSKLMNSYEETYLSHCMMWRLHDSFEDFEKTMNNDESIHLS